MAHETTLITKKAWLGPNGPEGHLLVCSGSLRWQPVAPGIVASGELRITLSSITNNQRAKDKPLVRITVAPTPTPQQQQQQQAGAPPAAPTHYVFAFETVPDRDAALDVLTKVIAGQAAAAAGNGAAGGKAGGGSAEFIAGLSRQQRNNMLARDADLRALHDELVGSGAVPEADFWSSVAARAAAAGGAAAAYGTAAAAAGQPGGGPVAVPGSRRRVGLSNILQRVEAEVDGRHQRVLRVSLTPEQVAQIFAEQPAVLRAFRDNVPHRMGEEDFWRRYVRYEMHKESKRKARAEGINPAAAAGGGGGLGVVDDAGGDIFREAAAAQAAEAATRPGAAAAALRRRVDPTLDLLAGEGERYAGHGLAHAVNREPEAPGARDGSAHHHIGGLEEPDDLASAINRHGEVVLEGVEALARVEAQLKGTAAQGGGQHHHHGHGHHHGHQGQQGHGQAHNNGSGPADGHHRHHYHDKDEQDGLPSRRRRRHSAGLDDLHAPPVAQLDTLSIADPRRYFERMKDFGDATGQPGCEPSGGGGGGGEDMGGGAGGLYGALDGVSYMDPAQLPLPPVAGAAAEAALLEATPLARAQAEDEAAGPGGAPARGGGGGGSRDPASSVPPETLAFLRRTVLSVNEACRHFWRALPASTPARREKAARLVKLLESKRGEVDALNDRARGVEGRFIRQLLKPPMDMLLAALVRWDEELSKRPGGAPGAAGQPQ